MDVSDGAVLIVEDAPDLRGIQALVLELAGYPVLTAADGLEALAILRREAGRVKLVVLDLMMPRFDGWAFLKEKQRDARVAAVPVVIVSATADDIKPPLAPPVRAALVKCARSPISMQTAPYRS